MSWARLLVMVFLVSFTVSALLSLLILDEMGDAAQARTLPPLLRHSTLPPSVQERILRQRARGGREEDVLESRRSTPLESDASGSVNTVASDAISAGVHLLDAYPLDDDSLAAGSIDGGIDSSASSSSSSEDDEGDDADPSSPSSFLFGTGGAGVGSGLEGLSLWSSLWRGLGVDLREWDVDISNLNHTWSQPSPESALQIQHQLERRAERERVTAAHATARASQSAVEPSNASPGVAPAHPARDPRPWSILHDLRPHQGVTPFVSLRGDFKRVRLALVHAFVPSVVASSSTSGADARGKGVVEWFERDANVLLYPLATIQPPPAPASEGADSEESPFASWDLDSIFAGSFSDDPSPSHRGATDRERVGGDWVLRGWAHVDGIVHATSASNAAGDGREQDLLVVAYEVGQGEDLQGGHTVLELFFRPATDWTKQQGGDESAAAEVHHRLSVPLQSLRTVTALSVHASALSLPDAQSKASFTVLYALRGDARVFRSVRVEAALDGSSGEWKLTWTPGFRGPPALRRGFVSQTVALLPYFGDDGGRGSNDSSAEGEMKVVASELNWLKGPFLFAAPLAANTVNRWTLPHSNPRRAPKAGAENLQSVPPYSAGVYSARAGADDSGATSSSDEFGHDAWISSRKTVGKYGADVHALSIHRGDGGSLMPLVAASSAGGRFIAFAQVPLITTVDGNANFDPVEIIHLSEDTVFTGLAFNSAGTVLAVSDNHQDIIVLQRSEQAANRHRYDELSKAEATPSNQTVEFAESTGSIETVSDDAMAAETSNVADASPASSDAAPSSDDSPPAPAAPPTRKRHSWEVMMEVVLPRRVRRLPLLSVQIVDVPIPAETLQQIRSTARSNSARVANDSAADLPSTAVADVLPQTTPFLLLLFQGGTVGAMQLSAVGPQLAAQQHQPASTFQSHFHHKSPSLSLDTFESFVANHWDLLFIVVSAGVWLLFSLPRFNRIAAAAAQQQQGVQAAAGAAAPRGFLRHFFFRPVQLNNNMGAQAQAPAPQQQPPQPPAQQPPAQQAVAAPVARNPLNPLFAIQQPQQQQQQQASPPPQRLADPTPAAAPLIDATGPSPAALPASPPAVAPPASSAIGASVSSPPRPVDHQTFTSLHN